MIMDMPRSRFVLVLAILGLSNSQKVQNSNNNKPKKLRGSSVEGTVADTNGSNQDFVTGRAIPPLWADDSNENSDRKNINGITEINSVRPNVPSLWAKVVGESSEINIKKENTNDIPSLWTKNLETPGDKGSILADSMESKERDIPPLWKLNGKEVAMDDKAQVQSTIWQAHSEIQFAAQSSSQGKMAQRDELQLKGALPPLWAADIHNQEKENLQATKSRETFQDKPSNQVENSNLWMKNNLISTNDVSSQDQITNTGSSKPIRRRFVSYQPSVWEMFWLKHIEALSESRLVCHVLLDDQLQYLRQYLEILCNRRLQSPYENWCVIDDGYAPLWFNLQNENRLELTFERPVPLLAHVSPPELIVPDSKYEEILSKFTFIDEITGETYVEYIEPLVGHLRFPIQKCLHPFPVTPQYRNSFLSFRGWIIPPPPVLKGENVLIVDAGGSKPSWESQRGGVTLKYLTETWREYGVDVDRLLVLSEDTSPEEFLPNVPSNIASKISFLKSRLAESSDAHSKETPFLPTIIQENSSKDDYVILKLDLSDLHGRSNYLKYFNSPENVVDEIIWEHKPEAMFLSEKLVSTDLTLKESFEIVLQLRQKGIRAHAWV
jgi:hypothetical protein